MLRPTSSQMKELLMESIPGKSVRGEVLAQFLPKYHRPAEPDVRGLPFRYDSANIFSGHSSILGGDPDAQKYVRGFRECAQLLDRRGVTRARRVEQIDGLSVGWAASSCIRETNGVMPIPALTQIWRLLSPSKVKRPYGPSTVTSVPGLSVAGSDRV